ncbi:methyl-accepting chemotaxis protein [Anabaena sp. UHCC 0253]|uniref:methyl-accepting chemotaxis protein n=1 Tax=Anabaena sp. UHCC 0253 TaxID=2590019 RepID=UPI00144860DC|nr:methyl-accepting chemotaxis protein [Anabaena sp. UHCC 0253]MTJ51477.1 methyl-accepting chemotaxis protein [Anabaena sp. UHCC 0253]
MFTNWKIKDLTLLGFSIPTSLLIIFSIMVYLNSLQTAKTLQEVKRVSKIAIDGQNLMKSGLAGMDRRMRRYVIDPLDYQDALEEYQKSQENFKTGFEDVKSLIKNSEQQNKLTRMKELYNQYDLLKENTVKSSLQLNKKENIVAFFNNAKIIAEEFEKVSDEFVKSEETILENNINRTESAINLLIILAVFTCILSLVVVGITYLLITKFLGSRVNTAIQLADKISIGDLRESVIEHQINNQDEIGQLIKAFQKTGINLSKLIRQIQQSGIQVTSSATQIAASGKQLETSITEQLASTNQVTVAAKEISATSRELVKTVEEVASLSQGTTVAASDSQKDLLQMETTMRQLVAATNSIAGRLGVISEKANNINNIVVTITKVADQTNLLSLNAAIEAEKAGEYGLGFAVVAREIRRLADQTAVATIDIEQMVKQMQSSVSTGVMEMDKFAAEVGRSVEDVGNISTQLGAIIDQVQELTPRYEVVSQGMEAQSQGASQISDAMSQLSSNSVQTAASLREINQAISQLNQVAQGLRQEMSRFQVNDVTEPYMEKSNRFLGDN